MDIGGRLRAARTRAGLTQSELARECGVSTAAISKFERSGCRPSLEVLLAIADALETTVDFLVRPASNLETRWCHRKLSTLGKRRSEALEVYAQDALERRLTLERIVYGDDLPAYDGPRNIAVTTPEDAEDAAQQLRDYLGVGVGPIVDLIGLLEQHDFRVAVAPEGFDGSEGLCAWAGDNVPFIMAASSSGDRRRFTVAHELAHLVCDVNAGLDDESIGHRFAGALLIPCAAIHDLVDSEGRIDTLDDLLPVKMEYGISVSALIYRYRDCGVISDRMHRRLYMSLSSRGWRKSEPGFAPLEEPREMDRLVDHALARGLVYEPRAAELKGLPLREFLAERRGGAEVIAQST